MENTPLRKKKYWPLLTVIIILVLFFILLILPSVCSTSLGKSLLEKTLSSTLSGSVKIQKIHLSWLHTQEIESFSYQSTDKTTSLNFEKLLIESSLLSLLFESKDPKLTQLISPVAQTTLPSTRAPRETRPIPFTSLLRNLVVQKGSLVLVTPEGSQAIFSDIAIKFEFLSTSIVSIKATSSFQSLDGSVDLYATSTDLDNCHLNLNLKQFPSLLIGALPWSFLSTSSHDLFGKTLNLVTTLDISKDTLSGTFDLGSSNLQASMAFITKDHLVSLTKPAIIKATITPLIYQMLTPASVHDLLKIKTSPILDWNISSLSVPYQAHAFNWEQLGYKAQLTSTPCSFVHKDTQLIPLNGLMVTSTSDHLANALSCSVDSSWSTSGKNPSYAKGSFTLAHLFDHMQMKNISADITQFPLAILDDLMDKKGQLTYVLGDTITLNIRPDHARYLVKIITPRLQIPSASIVTTEGFATENPVSFTYLVPTSSHIIASQPLKGSIDNFRLSLSGNKSLSENLLNTQIKLSSYPLKLTTPFFSNDLTVRDGLISINIESSSQANIKSSARVTYSNQTPMERQIMGSYLDIHCVTLFDLSKKDISIPRIELQTQSDTGSIEFTAALDNHLTQLRFLSPVKTQFLPSIKLLNMLIPNVDENIAYTLYTPIRINLDIEPLQLNCSLFEQTILHTELSLEKIGLINRALYQEFSLLDMKASIDIHAKNQEASGSFSSLLQQVMNNPISSKIQANFSSKEFNSWKMLKDHLSLSIALKDTPSNFVDLLLNSGTAVITSLGPTFDAQFKIQQLPATTTVSSEIKSPHMMLSGNVDIDDQGVYSQNNALKLHWTITPQAYLSLQNLTAKQENFELMDAVSLHCTVGELFYPFNLPLPPAKSPVKKALALVAAHIDKGRLSANLQVDVLKVRSLETQGTTTLENLKIDAIKKSTDTKGLLTISAKVFDAEHKEGRIAVSSQLQSLSNELIADIEAKLEHFPTTLLDAGNQFLGFNTINPSIILGKELNAILKSKLENLSGIFDFDIRASDALSSLHAFLNDGVLKLSQPLEAKLNLTQKLANTFLKNMNISLSLAKQPLELSIDSPGFYWPLTPFRIDQCRFRKARATLGEILCSNLGNPQDIGGFFKLNLNPNTPISLWFAPMDFSLNQGIVSIERTEVLFNRSYQICYWGKVDLNKKYVSMVLGLTEQSLRKAFGVRGLPKNFVLQIPMEGPIDNVKVNKEIATARIALLLAKVSGVAKQAGVFGNVVDLLGNMANDQGSVPPPKPPFPWQEALSQQEEEEVRHNTVHIIK